MEADDVSKASPPGPKPRFMQERGLTGLNYTKPGYVSEEFLPQLRNYRQQVQTYKEMSTNDPVIGAILFSFDMLIRQVEWTVTPNPMAEGDQSEDVEFLRQCMEDMSHTWEDFISEVLSMLVYGWSAFEIVYKRRSGPQREGAKEPSSNYDDRRIGWRKFAIRSQDTLDHWIIGDDGSVEGLVQNAPPDYRSVEIPIQKLLLFRTSTTKGNPQGKSVLRTAYRPWYFKCQMEKIEAIGVERDLAGLPVVKVPSEMLLPSATDEEKAAVDAMRAIATNIRRDAEEGIVWPTAYDEMGHQLYELSLLSSGGTRTFDTGAIIERYDRRITMSVLADFLFLGQGANGSFALSSDKTQLFAVAIGAWLGMIEGVVNQWGVRRLFEINGMDTSNPPLIKHGDVEKLDLTQLSTYVATLAGTGMNLFPDPELEAHLRDMANLPQPSEEVAQAFADAKAKERQANMAFQDQQIAEARAAAQPQQEPTPGLGALDPEMEQWSSLLGGE